MIEYQLKVYISVKIIGRLITGSSLSNLIFDKHSSVQPTTNDARNMAGPN